MCNSQTHDLLFTHSFCGHIGSNSVSCALGRDAFMDASHEFMMHEKQLFFKFFIYFSINECLFYAFVDEAYFRCLCLQLIGLRILNKELNTNIVIRNQYTYLNDSGSRINDWVITVMSNFL